ncbi:MAG: alpha/beta hydrolase [Thermoleophilaceae bacterium]|nr:alpha/beta hydrolase [Thermoleophilaceae bacterium]
MDERFADVGRGVTLCYETFGNESDPPLLLVMGLGMQMVGWHEDFCGELAGRGFHVVRFDNRDAGRSTHFPGPTPTLRQLLSRRFHPNQYRLADMADDATGLLRELDLAPAHVVGASMGGMIAQTMAAHHPDSVRTLTSIMSNTGSRFSGQPALSLYRPLLTPAPQEKEAFLDHVEKIFTRIGSPGRADVEDLRQVASLSYDRARDPASTIRQLGAILASGNRVRDLRRIKAPTLVVHGSADKLVRPSGGRATAKAIPGARLLRIEGMGHDLPRAFWPRIIDAIAEHARSARSAVAA